MPSPGNWCRGPRVPLRGSSPRDVVYYALPASWKLLLAGVVQGKCRTEAARQPLLLCSPAGARVLPEQSTSPRRAWTVCLRFYFSRQQDQARPLPHRDSGAVQHGALPGFTVSSPQALGSSTDKTPAPCTSNRGQTRQVLGAREMCPSPAPRVVSQKSPVQCCDEGVVVPSIPGPWSHSRGLSSGCPSLQASGLHCLCRSVPSRPHQGCPHLLALRPTSSGKPALLAPLPTQSYTPLPPWSPGRTDLCGLQAPAPCSVSAPQCPLARPCQDEHWKEGASRVKEGRGQWPLCCDSEAEDPEVGRHWDQCHSVKSQESSWYLSLGAPTTAAHPLQGLCPCKLSLFNQDTDARGRDCCPLHF